MFGIARFLRSQSTSMANDHGFNDAWLGMPKVNPYLLGSVDYQQYEWGWNEAKDMEQEWRDAPSFYPSNEYGEY